MLLADALRIATVPGAAPGRLLVVRSLELGDIHAEASPASLALSIDRRLLQLDAAAVSWEDARAAHAPAVVFRDDAEPHVALALRLAERQPVDAWFWPLAVRGWLPTLPRADALRTTLLGVLRTRAGPGALLRLVDELGERDALDPVLGALRRQDATELLRELGWPAPADLASAREPHPALASGGRPLVDRPAPASPDALGSRPGARAWAQPWASVIERWIPRWPAADPRSVWLVAMALAAEQPARLVDPRLATHAHHVAIRILAAAETSEAATARASAARAARSESSAGQGTETSREPSPGVRAPMRADETTLRASDHAGLLFVIAILTRLGMTAFLQARPDLVDLDVPRRLLHRLADRLSIAAADPVRAAVGPLTAANDGAAIDFVAPAQWFRGIALRGPLIVRRREAEQGIRLLFDGHGVLPLARWRGRAPDAVRACIRDWRLHRGRPLPRGRDVDVLIMAWQVALRRWSRHYAHMGLQELVCRPGRIVATRTHVDIVLAHRDADVRVRRAGLDIDPGWVPWLGRVVGFHYRDD